LSEVISMEWMLCSLGVAQTRARACGVCASSSRRTFRGACQERGGTDHIETAGARRPEGPLVTGCRPRRGRCPGAWAVRGQRAGLQGGQQSGAAGEVPLANTKFAGRLKNNRGVGLPTDNRQAEVAMDWLTSQAARPDATAARHTDARSLAVPAPRSTLNPSSRPRGIPPTGSPSGERGRDVSCLANR
jgi:hypothetical protein